MTADGARTWILTGSPENYAATAAHGFSVIGCRPGKPGKADSYPWRFEIEPELVLEEADWVGAESLKDDLEHIRKWPAEHWKLAFQGQLRTVSDADAALLMDRMQAAAGVSA
jgi:hypothetical protein